METSVDNLRLLLGLKLKRLRQDRGASLKEIAQSAGVSVSYLSEIEKGKKYPKTDKLIDLARALGVPFDDLVSQRVDEPLRALKQAIGSPFAQEFPFRLFGIGPEDVLSLIADRPDQAGALVGTIAEVARNHDLRVEHFLLAALRSYQQLNGNHFEGIEARAEAERAERGWDPERPISASDLRAVLETEFGYSVDTETLLAHPDLRGFRSVFVADAEGGPVLYVNGQLLPSQQAFVFARELGYELLDVAERATTSSWLEVTSFEQVLSNFEVSYFAGALLLSRQALVRDLTAFFDQPTWREAAFRAAFERYDATPEMFFYRLTQVIPAAFGLGEIYFMRFSNARGSTRYDLTKVLNMSRVPVPHGVRRDEHYCRRWPAVRALQSLDIQQQAGDGDAPTVQVQRSHFLNDGATFFEIALARPLALTEGTNTAVSLGFLVNDGVRDTVRFWDDPAVHHLDVNLTCERCPLLPDECLVRAAPPTVLERTIEQARRRNALAELGLALG